MSLWYSPPMLPHILALGPQPRAVTRVHAPFHSCHQDCALPEHDLVIIGVDPDGSILVEYVGALPTPARTRWYPVPDMANGETVGDACRRDAKRRGL